MDKKKYAIIINILLLVWYFLSMVGLKIGGKYLVESAFKEEWIFMLIPTLTFLLFIFLLFYLYRVYMSRFLLQEFTMLTQT